MAAQASVSERGRSALFKNPLFFSGKFLGCYIEAAQNFIRYVTIFDRDRGQKTSLTKLVLKRSVLKQSLPHSEYRRSPDSAVFGFPANRTIVKTALIGD